MGTGTRHESVGMSERYPVSCEERDDKLIYTFEGEMKADEQGDFMLEMDDPMQVQSLQFDVPGTPTTTLSSTVIRSLPTQCGLLMLPFAPVQRLWRKKEGFVLRLVCERQQEDSALWRALRACLPSLRDLITAYLGSPQRYPILHSRMRFVDLELQLSPQSTTRFAEQEVAFAACWQATQSEGLTSLAVHVSSVQGLQVLLSCFRGGRLLWQAEMARADRGAMFVHRVAREAGDSLILEMQHAAHLLGTTLHLVSEFREATPVWVPLCSSRSGTVVLDALCGGILIDDPTCSVEHVSISWPHDDGTPLDLVHASGTAWRAHSAVCGQRWFRLPHSQRPLTLRMTGAQLAASVTQCFTLSPALLTPSVTLGHISLARSIRSDPVLKLRSETFVRHNCERVTTHPLTHSAFLARLLLLVLDGGADDITRARLVQRETLGTCAYSAMQMLVIDKLLSGAHVVPGAYTITFDRSRAQSTCLPAATESLFHACRCDGLELELHWDDASRASGVEITTVGVHFDTM